MDTSEANIILVETTSIGFISTDIDCSPLFNWLSPDVFDTPTDHAPADRSTTDGLSIDGVDTSSASCLANRLSTNETTLLTM
jgi:hypothetical protein